MTFGGIENTGTVDGARYIAQAGREQNPVTYVSFFDAMRFVNWLHNGQGSGDTESGVYTIVNGLDEERSADAKFWIPSEDEWYKAAYYDPMSGVYYDYPTGTDTDTYSDNPASLNTPDDTNVANFSTRDGIDNGYNDGWAVSQSTSFDPSINPFTDVGAYSLAVSPYGTFDQGGNVYEWTEGFHSSFCCRILRGGSWNLGLTDLRADNRFNDLPTGEVHFQGFRVAAAPGLVGDCNDDSVFNAADLSCISSIEARDVVLDALNTLPGDLDGNGVVAFADFLALSANFGTVLSSYADGNIDLNNGVEFEDFLVLSGNFGKTADDVAAVPEPADLTAVGLALTVLLTSSRRSAHRR